MFNFCHNFAKPHKAKSHDQQIGAGIKEQELDKKVFLFLFDVGKVAIIKIRGCISTDTAYIPQGVLVVDQPGRRGYRT